MGRFIIALTSLTLDTTTLHKTVRVRKVIVIMNEVNFMVWFFHWLAVSQGKMNQILCLLTGVTLTFSRRRQLLFKGGKYFFELKF